MTAAPPTPTDFSDVPPITFHHATYRGLETGPRLIVIGSVHGNEKCGTQAIHRLQKALQSQEVCIERGTLTLVPIANPLAYARNTRMGDRNLNRKLQPTDNPLEFEDKVANWLCPLLAEHDALLDLHSFHTAGQPFALIGPLDNQGQLEPFNHAHAEEALARHLGVQRVVDGWLETYALGIRRRQANFPSDASQADALYGVGTTEYMRTVGGWGITLECGQHDDPQAPEVAYRAILNCLKHLGMIQGQAEPQQNIQALRLYDVVDKLDAADRFNREWASFDRLQVGDVIGQRANGEILKAEEDGYIVFPNPEAQAGAEWFYLARPTTRLS